MKSSKDDALLFLRKWATARSRLRFMFIGTDRASSISFFGTLSEPSLKDEELRVEGEGTDEVVACFPLGRFVRFDIGTELDLPDDLRGVVGKLLETFLVARLPDRSGVVLGTLRVE